MTMTVSQHGRPMAAIARRLAMLAVLLAAFATASPASAAPPAPQPAQAFAKPEEAVAALVSALGTHDTRVLRTIFGAGGERIIASGDPVADRNGREAFLKSYAEAHMLTPQGDARQVLVIGNSRWPFPVPLVRADNAWRFDAAAGAQELINRRIGRNELMTIRTLLAMVEAQKDYFDRVQRGSGAGAYARQFRSSPGAQDGLYWDAAAGEAPSPLAPLLDQAQDEGYPGGQGHNGAQVPHYGYLYRILSAQGPSAFGGAKDYVRNGAMSGGFAILAWPVKYGTSGVVTFIVNGDGVVFQKDLGPTTARIAAAMRKFDPDVTWARVDIKD